MQRGMLVKEEALFKAKAVNEVDAKWTLSAVDACVGEGREIVLALTGVRLCHVEEIG